MTLSTPTLDTGKAVVEVAQVSGPTNPANFRLNLEFNGTFGMSAPMPDTNNGTVILTSALNGSFNFTVQWTDTDSDGMLGVRDYFTVSHAGGMPHPGTYVFYVLWQDGVPIASVSFATT